MMAQKTVHVEGSVDHAPTATPTLRINQLYLGDDQLVTIPVREGKFAADAKLEFPMEVGFSVNGSTFPVWLEPGADLRVDVKSGKEDKSELICSGKTGPESNFLYRFHHLFGNHYLADSMNKKLLDSNIDMLELHLFEYRKAEQAFWEAESKANSFSPAFSAHIATQIQYNYNRWLAAYPIVRANAHTADLTVKPLPRAVEKGMSTKEVQNPTALSSIAYREFTFYYITYLVSKENGFKKFTDMNIALNKKLPFATKHLADQALNWFTTRITVDLLSGLAPGTVDRMKTLVKKGTMGDLYIKYLDRQIAKVNAAKAADDKKNESDKALKGERYAVEVTDLNGNPLKLSDFKGKIVYIDFWASWCGPCKREMPFSKELHDKLAKSLDEKQMKDIVFLYISIDKTEEPWRAAIKALELGGIQGFSAADNPKGVGAFFQVNSIPRYMLMDRSGEIINLNASRPSDPATEQMLLDLLRK